MVVFSFSVFSFAMRITVIEAIVYGRALSFPSVAKSLGFAYSCPETHWIIVPHHLHHPPQSYLSLFTSTVAASSLAVQPPGHSILQWQTQLRISVGWTSSKVASFGQDLRMILSVMTVIYGTGVLVVGLGPLESSCGDLLELIRFVASVKPFIAASKVSERIITIIQSILLAAVPAQELAVMESMQVALETIVSAVFDGSNEFGGSFSETQIALCRIFEGLLQQLLSLKWTEPKLVVVLGHYFDALGPFLKYFPDAVGSVINKLFELLTSLPFVLKDPSTSISRHARLQICTSFIRIAKAVDKSLLPHMKLLGMFLVKEETGPRQRILLLGGRTFEIEEVAMDQSGVGGGEVERVAAMTTLDAHVHDDEGVAMVQGVTEEGWYSLGRRLKRFDCWWGCVAMIVRTRKGEIRCILVGGIGGVTGMEGINDNFIWILTEEAIRAGALSSPKTNGLLKLGQVVDPSVFQVFETFRHDVGSQPRVVNDGPLTLAKKEALTSSVAIEPPVALYSRHRSVGNRDMGASKLKHIDERQMLV
ncbi:hypothetical protein TEA_015803 [Camellia sinensis var. sinensis]|uniref:Exportin-5 C-terminal domain-containing protein n=1 Tax=Camellia sinensis var. sinensis TaxID=542762 RepID=A0A4S4EJ07_CAMSN|nr:hypothetical protein TEA_015803 [Camellia sinensis var. sinensis]